MKLYWLLLVVLLLLIAPISGLSLNFQQPADFTEHVTCVDTGKGGTCSWFQNQSGGNNYVLGFHMGVRNTDPLIMSYSAATEVEEGLLNVVIYDSLGNEMWRSVNYTTQVDGRRHRFQLHMVGGQAYLYLDETLRANSTYLNQNPSYVAWADTLGTGRIDDIIWGGSENRYVYDVPESSAYGEPLYVLKKDFINPDANGFYWANGTLISTWAFPTFYSKATSNHETIYFHGYTTGINVLSYETDWNMANYIPWNLTEFFEIDPPYGLYVLYVPGTLKYSDPFFYVSSGATISWDSPSYSQGETGAIITAVTDGGYWDTATYNYRIDVINIYGEVQATYPVTTQTATVTHTWEADQDIGLYYAVIIAEPKDVNVEDIWMNAALTEVDAYLTLSGYVHDGETTLVIPNTTINITQAGTVNEEITGEDGYYSVGEMSSGSTVSINVSAAGYETYLHQFTPLRVGAISLNFTLLPIDHTYSGIALGGVARELPYNRTLNSVNVTIRNGTTTYFAETNSVGYYINDYMPHNYLWDIWGSKTGFMNSTVYQKLVVGS